MLCGIGWITLRLEAVLAGLTWQLEATELPGLLAELLVGDTSRLEALVGVPWRAATIAATLTLAAMAAGWAALRWWLDWQAGARHRRRLQERTRSHTWATRRDLAPLLGPRPAAGGEPPAAGRLLVGTHGGRDVLAPARTSVMVIAPTRTGKSTRLVVPNLLRWEGPAVVTSVKRDVHDLTVARRATFGPTSLFDPTGSTGLPSVRWSPLLTATTFPDAVKTATWLADAASVEDKQESAKFWETLATKLLAPMLYAAANTRRTIMDVSHWVDRSAFDEVATILEHLGDRDAAAAWRAIRDLPVETRGSVLGTAMAIFRGFGSPRVRQATSCTPGDTDNTLNIAKLLHKNGTLYLVSPEYEQAELRPVFVALVQAVYRAAVELSAGLLAGAPLSPPLLMMLDEAGNIAPLHSLPKIASTGAGQGICLMTIWQDRAQIRQIYGDAERTVISNHTTSVWLPGSQDLDTLKLLTDLIGDQWVASSTISAAPDGGLSVSESSERIDVAPPAFLRTLEHGSAVVLSGNTPPALVRTHAYYQQRRWRQLIDPGQLERHAAMHHGGGPSTAALWDQHGYNDQLPDAPRPLTPPTRAGSLGAALEATYEGLDAEHARTAWGQDAEVVPTRLSTAPGRWKTITLPDQVAAHLDHDGDQVDLADPAIRRKVLAVWLTVGPADALADTVTLPQLRAEWASLNLPDHTRDCWHDSYPDLASCWPAQPVHPTF